jgi:hypothetical protein
MLLGGGLSIGSSMLPHATAAKSMAMSCSLTYLWTTEVWRSLHKSGGGARRRKASSPSMTTCSDECWTDLPIWKVLSGTADGVDVMAP